MLYLGSFPDHVAELARGGGEGGVLRGEQGVDEQTPPPLGLLLQAVVALVLVLLHGVEQPHRRPLVSRSPCGRKRIACVRKAMRGEEKQPHRPPLVSRSPFGRKTIECVRKVMRGEEKDAPSSSPSSTVTLRKKEN